MYTPHLNVAVEAAYAAAHILKKYWGQLKTIEEKQAGDLVTNADRETEEEIIKILKGYYPMHGILAEESGGSLDHEYVWVIDPLDGTTNYTHQFPMTAISIGLMHKGEPVAGVVYNPFFQELFSCSKGRGAYLNGNKISVSSTHQLSKSLLATGFAYDRISNCDTNYKEFCHLTHISQGVRRLGSASLDLAYVSAGRLDGYWERGLKPWDIAAGILLVKEAGGLVTSYDGTALDIGSGRVMATNGKLHSELQKALKDSRGYNFPVLD